MMRPCASETCCMPLHALKIENPSRPSAIDSVTTAWRMTSLRFTTTVLSFSVTSSCWTPMSALLLDREDVGRFAESGRPLHFVSSLRIEGRVVVRSAKSVNVDGGRSSSTSATLSV